MRAARRGFVLAEVVVVLVISAVVLVALLAGLVALVRGLQPQQVKIQGEVLPIAPTFGSFPAAVGLHQTFAARIATARAIYVFGGRHLSIPSDSPPALLRPLKADKLPAIADFSAGLPLDAKSFHEQYSSQLGDDDPSCGPDDFSIIVIGSLETAPPVTCLAQVRRTDVSVTDGSGTNPFVIREVELWDVDRGYQRYAYVERPALSSAVFVGAIHTWMRYRLDAAAEEGPACVVFPDPWIFAGARERPNDVPPYSRFSYLLAISP